MGSITLHPTNEADYQLLIELAKRLNLSFTTDEQEDEVTQEVFLESIERGVQEINDHRKGTIKLRSAYDLLNEL
jgi:hypothetical protein